MDPTIAWACIVALSVLAYVVLDGFDLGVGILFAAESDDADRETMVGSIAPVWDGNETWLVLGGGSLLAVFPLAYATILPALYIPVMGMLLALVFRGVAFEFRFRAPTRRGRRAWDLSFMCGSVIAALCQGFILGGILQGIKVSGRAFAGGQWDWLAPFPVACGISLVVGYALLGSTWLVLKTEGPLQDRCRAHALRLGAATLGAIVVVSLWTPFLHPRFAERWFGTPGIFLTSPVPALVALLAWRGMCGLRRGDELAPFLCALGWFILCFAGIGISIYPLAVPPDIDIWMAAAPRSSQVFLLSGACVLIPVVLAYTAVSYRVFRGKVRPGMHGH